MSLTAERLEELIFGTERYRRFTQDSPVMPDVWIRYGRDPSRRVDLLLTPHTTSSASELGFELQKRLGDAGTARVAYNESHVVAELAFEELVKVGLPLTHWWREHVWRPRARVSAVGKLRDPAVRKRVIEHIERPGMPGFGGGVSPDLVWLLRIVARIQLERGDLQFSEEPPAEQLLDCALELLGAPDVGKPPPDPLLWR
ncbi:MAG: hypothetical protein ABR521_04815, partial [Gaiellaceae bacterium]